MKNTTHTTKSINLDSVVGFNMFTGGESESWEDILKPSPEKFLATFPQAKNKLKNALRKINFKFKGKFIVDLSMPNWVGGYYAESIEMIAINPWLLLYGSEKDIAHVLFHEGLHAGIYTEGVKVDDESMVESMTKKRMSEIYGGPQFKSGYDELVEDFNQYFGDLSFNDMTEMIEDGDESTFNNLLEVMVVNPSFDEGGIESLSWDTIQNRLGKTWDTLQELFPRMMNTIAGRNVGVHAGTNVALHHFELDGLLEKVTRRILENNPEIIEDVFMKLTNDGEENLKEDFIADGMYKLGFGYLFDFEPEILKDRIKEFVDFRNTLDSIKNIKFDFGMPLLNQ